MPKRYPDRGRRRPGRRPPCRHHSGSGPNRPAGFTGPGFGRAWGTMLPGLAGPEKKAFFNELGGGIALAAGACGLMLGLICFGWIGAIIGLGAGLAAGGSFAGSRGFYRS